jgi:hypothetical protein
MCGQSVESLSVKASGVCSGRIPPTKTLLLSFNRTQCRVVTGLLTGHNTLRRHLCVMGLSNDPACRKCGAEDNSVHILCVCEALASFGHAHMGSIYLDPKDTLNLSVGAIRNFGKEPDCCNLLVISN